MKLHLILPAVAAIAVSPLLFLSLVRGETSPARFADRDAWLVSNAKLRVTILQSGGHIGEITLSGPDGVNPLWMQSKPTIDPDKYDPKKHASVYGGGAVARLMSGLMGHNVCFPFWGNPSRPRKRPV